MDDTQKKDGMNVQENGEERTQNPENAQQIPDGNAADGQLPDNDAALTDGPVDEDSAFLENDGGDGYVSQFGDLVQEETAGEAVMVKTKKRRFLMPSIIIAIVIFVLAAVAGAVYLLFFNITPAGVWSVDGDKTSGSVYVFDNNGVAELVTGSFTYKGTYAIKDGKMNLYIPVGTSAIQGDFDCVITGNMITGKSLSLSIQGQETKFIPAVLPENKLTPAKDRKTDDKMTGTWKLKDSSNNVSYTFNADGTIRLESDNMRIDGIYTLKDGKIVTTYIMGGQENSMEEEYSFDKDTLLISSAGYEKIK